MLQISPQRSVAGLNSMSFTGSRSCDVSVKQHPHRGGGVAVNDKLHAAVAQHRAVGQRIAELHLRLGRFAGRFRHDDKGSDGQGNS